MPFDVAKSCGKWKHHSASDSYQQIMEKLGAPAEMIEKIKETEFPVENSLSGNTFKTKAEFMGKTIENTFTLGEEGEEDDPMGKKRKATYTMEGDCLVSVYPDYDGKGLKMRVSRHFVDDNTMHSDMKVGDLEGWQVSKRC